ncbi:MAG TPA: gliding motility-associated C-terminal domain-containing protein, partial [Flavipsychrobacter sp.]|nr:gliding motility-associated C-terminal domain-containing protein [Flavipsychrobacter sp.]
VNNPTLENAIFTGTKTTEMTFTVSTPDGCKGKDSLHITVFSVSFLKGSADTSICPGDTAHLHVSGDSIAHVLWSPGAFLTDTNTLTTKAYPLISSTYTVYGVNVDGCLDTVSVSVAVKAGAVIDLPDSVTIYPGESYQMDPGGNCLYFSWFPPLGLSSDTISNPVATPDVNTRYIVNGATEGGCKAKDSMEVYVSLDSYINVPNAFSPGNGPNNLLKVVHTGEATLKSFVIYDRWGQKMFETSDINQGWDGTFNGQPQPMGVYVYVVEAYTFRGKRFYKQGNITLLR